MRKAISFVLLLTGLTAFGQGMSEHIVINWPGEYNWKNVRTGDHDNVRTSVIIPGNESVATASIMGSLKVYKGTQYRTVADIIKNYRSRLDAGTTFTLIDQQQNTTYPWVIFKVETAATQKYPEAESDLYYVVQGRLALYENYVAIKAARLSDEFVRKWRAVFMTGQVRTD